MRAVLLALALILAPSFAAAQPVASEGGILIFVASPPLWGPTDAFNGAFNFDERSLSLAVDNKTVCQGKESDPDSGWLCKADGQFGPGPHAITVQFIDAQKAPRVLRATLNLALRDLKLEYPDAEDKGERFWCVAVTAPSLRLMSKADPRCETD